jgi:hypothetical protein
VSGTIALDGIPVSSALAYTNGLNDDPACRTAWVARLNGEAA